MMIPTRTAGVGLLLALSTAAVADTITFKDGCREGTRVVAAGVGDLLFHASLQRRALAMDGSYRAFWSPVQTLLTAADITYGNLEGPAAPGVSVTGRNVRDPGRVLDGYVYGPAKPTKTELIFNYHPAVLADLAASGFDVISTANNHAADRGALGVERTIDGLEANGLKFTGTRRRGETDAERRWSVVTEANGVRLAWIACTYGTNDVAAPAQILRCFNDRDVVLGEIRALAADATIDAVVLTPHWGVENSSTPDKGDRAFARAAIDAGASVVIGTHPHVLQPWEKMIAADGREGLVIYSTGNFISNQPWELTRHGIVALVEWTKVDGEKAVLSAAGYVPTRVDWTEEGHRVNAINGRASSLLPEGNRVSLERFRDLPRACPAVAAGVPN